MALPESLPEATPALVDCRLELRGTPVRGRRETNLPTDHPALHMLREVAALRRSLDDREVEAAALRGELAQAYQRECELVRILHRYVVAEQAAASRRHRHWWQFLR